MVFYDAGGNPTLLRGVPLTWGEGRRLKRVSLSWGTVDFAYESDGKRVRKTSGGNTTTYYYNGNVLSGLVRKASKDAGTTGTGTDAQATSVYSVTLADVTDADGNSIFVKKTCLLYTSDAADD